MLNDQNKPDLVSIYESMYGTPNAAVVQENSEVDFSVLTEAKKKDKKKKFNKEEGNSNSFKGKSKREIGAITYDSTDYTSYMNSLMKQVNEEFGEETIGDDDEETFDFDAGEPDGDELGGGDAESVLSEIYDILKEYFGENGEDGVVDADESENMFDDGADEGLGEDEVPFESYGFEGDGKEHGDQGNYDGKASVAKKTTLVGQDGKALVGKSQKTGYNPQQNGTGNASEHGAKGNYDGKATVAKKTDLVGQDGNAAIKKSQKTGYKPNKEKTDFRA